MTNSLDTFDVQPPIFFTILALYLLYLGEGVIACSIHTYTRES
jgi:hypothetical protein